MGRSNKEQVSANHDRIVSTAGRLLRARGYESVGIAEVMREAGMTQGGFYKHFSSKEALAAAAWADGFEKVEAIWRDVGGGNSPAASLVDYYLAPKAPDYRCPMLAHGEEAGRMQDGSDLRAIYLSGAKSLYETFIEETEGTVDNDRAKLLFAAMLGANLLARIGDQEWIDDIKEAVVRAAHSDAEK